MTWVSARLLLPFTFLLTGPAWGAAGPDDGPAETCTAILAKGGLDREAFLDSADELAADTRGLKALAVAVHWAERPARGNVNDARLIGTGEIGPAVTYTVRPMRTRDGPYVALLTGPRRAVLTEVRRLEGRFGGGRLRFATLMSDALAWTPPPTVTPVTASSLNLLEVIFNNQRGPNLALYDTEAADLYFVAGPETLATFEGADLIGSGVALNSATDLSSWWTHPFRAGEPSHLIHVRHYGVLSQMAYRTLRRLATEDAATPRRPRRAALFKPLRACLDLACRSKIKIPGRAALSARP